MLKMAEIEENDVVYDLGCGDGRIIVAAASRFGARAVGIEADPLRFLFSWLRVKLCGLGDKVKVIWGNFFSYNLADATVITVFLSHEANSKLKEKLQKELSPGARVVSYYWLFHGWKVIKFDPVHQLYMYRIGD
ncbi:class I SAM-dependent methyltransferase [Candidatus Aerophobetes bacterium]|nr:class I SAM-dependent methyltransferase [Candidatus Aerophobetes bacterium]